MEAMESTGKHEPAQAAAGGGAPDQGDALHRLSDWAQQNVRVLAGVAIVAAIAAAALLIFRTHRSATEHRAAEMLGTAQSAQQIEDVLQQYPHSAAAPHALIRLAKEHYAALDYSKADEAYARFLEQYPAHEWASTAQLGRILCMEAAGRTAEALQGYVDFIAQHADHYQWGQAVLGQARCLEQLGRLAEARTVYEDFIAKAAGNPWTTMAEQSLERLNRRIDREKQ